MNAPLWHSLWRVPALGGDAVRLVDHVDTPVSFSPNGKRFAFIRRTREKGESLLVLANADGSGERAIATRKYPQDFGGDNSAPAWSPDGKIIACGLGEAGLNNMAVVGIDLESGKQTQLSSLRWFRVGRLAWMPDARGMVMLATPGLQFTYQLWYLSYPAGEARQISNDLNDYQSVSLTADGKRLVTVQTVAFSNIWVTPANSGAAKQITSETETWSNGLSWAPEGKIVYWSNASGEEDLWIVGADGRNPKQLTANMRINQGPSVSPDGRSIAFTGDRTGLPHIWKTTIDGSNPQQLTFGAGEAGTILVSGRSLDLLHFH